MTGLAAGGLGLRSGFEPPDLDRPGRLPHQQGLCEARLGYQDESPPLGPRDPVLNVQADTKAFMSCGHAKKEVRVGRGRTGGTVPCRGERGSGTEGCLFAWVPE